MNIDQRCINVFLIGTPVVSEDSYSFIMYGKTSADSYCQFRINMTRSMFLELAKYTCRNIGKQFFKRLKRSLFTQSKPSTENRI